jgi:hypothetical protein
MPRILLASVLFLICLLYLSGPALAQRATADPGGDDKGPAAAKEAAPKEKVQPDAKENEPKSKFLRLRRDDKGEPVALETAVVRYVPADDTRDGLAVDLVGAVHVGEKGYYEELNRLFTAYDALLYELVAPEGTRIPKDGRREGGGNPVSALQLGMKSMLELEFQLERVDYSKENFVHADMSPEEFSKSMSERGESFLQMFFRMMAQGMAAQNKNVEGTSDVELLFALFAKDRAFRLKRTLAGQFENMEGALSAFNGPDGSTIITERNRKAFEVLASQIKAGKKKIGVFYGAGHLSDMEQRLFKDFNLKRGDEKWLTAWSLERAAKKETEKIPDKAPQADAQPDK